MRHGGPKKTQEQPETTHAAHGKGLDSSLPQDDEKWLAVTMPHPAKAVADPGVAHAFAQGGTKVRRYDLPGTVSLDSYLESGQLTRGSIVAALQELSDRMGEKGQHGEILIIGGAAMILAYQNREGTKDIDAIIDPKTTINKITKEMADYHGLPEGWLNDAAKAFVPENTVQVTEGVPQFPNLTVYLPEARALFAMKAQSSRLDPTPAGQESRDMIDLRTLVKVLGIQGQDDAEVAIQKYLPPEKIPLRFWYALDEILGREATE